MATNHDVRVTGASVLDGRYRTTCACTCGWTGESDEARQAGALAEAARIRVDHLLEAHPKQTPSSFFRPRAAARYRHPRSLSAATQQGRRWVRYAGCACGWTHTVHGRSAAATARIARTHHLEHVNLQTGRTPWRDYVVLVALLVLGVAVVGVLAAIAISSGGGDPTDLGSLFG
ncbi:hypothetical protein [Nocardioides sp. 1609]|uniref:hypothetical protein n=1 Tax=Nocardioides sp. 1609 TaxID=2508327 RepID=UPI00106F43AB|nr:hypothetical protein [Nocardioides sp. 1609]